MEEEKGTVHGRLRTLWIEEIWKGKHGLKYAWNYKEEDGMLKTLVSYVASNFKHEDPERKTEEVMREFMKSKDEILEKRLHPFSWLVRDRARYAKKTMPKVEAPIVIQKAPEPIEWKPTLCDSTTDETILASIVPNPISYAMGLQKTGVFLKKHKPELYARMRKLCLEVLGQEGLTQLKKRLKEKEVEGFAHV